MKWSWLLIFPLLEGNGNSVDGTDCQDVCYLLRSSKQFAGSAHLACLGSIKHLAVGVFTFTLHHADSKFLAHLGHIERKGENIMLLCHYSRGQRHSNYSILKQLVLIAKGRQKQETELTVQKAEAFRGRFTYKILLDFIVISKLHGNIVLKKWPSSKIRHICSQPFFRPYHLPGIQMKHSLHTLRLQF